MGGERGAGGDARGTHVYTGIDGAFSVRRTELLTEAGVGRGGEGKSRSLFRRYPPDRWYFFFFTKSIYYFGNSEVHNKLKNIFSPASCCRLFKLAFYLHESFMWRLQFPL